MDVMLLNSFFAWNMSAKTPDSTKFVVKKTKYYAAMAEEMIQFVDSSFNVVDMTVRNAGVSCLDHSPDLADKQQRLYCLVCKLDDPMRKAKGLKDKYNLNSRTRSCLYSCSNESCYVQAHAMKVKHDRKIFQMECFHGMSCFDIAHTDAGKSLWKKVTIVRRVRR